MTQPTKLFELGMDALVELYELDATSLGDTVYRFTLHDAYGAPIVWNGVTYTPYPVMASGFERRANGTQPRPTMIMSNMGGFISAICKETDDLIGAKVTRIRTLKKYLDYVNHTLRPNGDWTDDTNHWTVNPTATGVLVSGGQFTATSGPATNQLLSRVIDSTVLGRQYTVWLKRIAGNAGIYVFNHTSGSQIAGLGSVAGAPADCIVTFTGTGTPVRIDIVNGTSTETSTIGSVSYLDGFTPDPTVEFPREIWRIDRRAGEGRESVTFELATPWDVSGVRLPRRIVVQNSCTWAYRSSECGYAGGPVAKADDTATSNPLLDVCGKRVSSCKLRFGATAELPFGAFPGVGQTTANT